MNETVFESEQLFSLFFHLIRFYSSDGIHRRRMRIYQHIVIIVLSDTYCGADTKAKPASTFRLI